MSRAPPTSTLPDSPSSFCFICTESSCHELVGMLLSLSLQHPNIDVYGFVDTPTDRALAALNPKLQLTLHVVVNMDRYTNKNRQIMEREGVWGDFLTQKAHVILHALERSADTAFVDSDILFLNPVKGVDRTAKVGVCPHFIPKKNTDEVGFYNAGFLWASDPAVAHDWIKFNKTSRFDDQASVEDLVEHHAHFEFGEEVNVMPWRLLLSRNPRAVMAKFGMDKDVGQVLYCNKPLTFVHTHFEDKRFQYFNDALIWLLKNTKRYKELLIIDRILHRKWRLCIPRQPRKGIYNHTNDSFRELAPLLQRQNAEDTTIEVTDKPHCYLGSNVILYDRPTNLWTESQIARADLLLLGNGDVKTDGAEIVKAFGVPVLPWIFWPRRPSLLEDHLASQPHYGFDERTVESVFIGNVENSTQAAFRETPLNWESAIEEYVCTKGLTHKYTQAEYLTRLSNARFGLCLRGYGSKCHREVELMALGTVPLVTPQVSISSYMDPPVENTHYLRVSSPDDVKRVISNVTPERWQMMSDQCREWYMRNVHSKNAFGTFMSHIFYGSNPGQQPGENVTPK